MPDSWKQFFVKQLGAEEETDQIQNQWRPMELRGRIREKCMKVIEAEQQKKDREAFDRGPGELSDRSASVTAPRSGQHLRSRTQFPAASRDYRSRPTWTRQGYAGTRSALRRMRRMRPGR